LKQKTVQKNNKQNRLTSDITENTLTVILIAGLVVFAVATILPQEVFAFPLEGCVLTCYFEFPLRVGCSLTCSVGVTISEPEPDWNNDDKDNSDEGDPLVFSMTDKQANVIRNWPEQHESFLTEFDLFDNGENVTLSRTLDEGTMTLFLDLNGDGKLSDGTEWLYDQNENVYQILSRPLIDSNQNGFFDYSDDLWSIAMVKDGDKYYPASELGIVAFNWSNHLKGYGDMHGDNRQYADCLYEGKYHYPDCNAVSENHFAIAAYNQNSILVNDGRVLDSFGIVMGYLDMSNTTKQTP